MAISIPPDALREVVAAAIVSHVSAAERETIMIAAVKHLLEPSASGRYGEKGPSPMQAAFNAAAEQIAREEARTYLAGNEDFKANLRAVINDALAQAFDEKREATVARMASAIAAAWEKGERY
jgi:hypothetical protein